MDHWKVLTFLTSLREKRLALSFLREHNFKNSFLEPLNPICIGSLDIEALNHFFLHCPRFFNGRQNLLLKTERIIPTFLEKVALVLHKNFFMMILVFQQNLATTYSIDLLTTYYRQGFNLLSLKGFFIFFFVIVAVLWLSQVLFFCSLLSWFYFSLVFLFLPGMQSFIMPG